MPQAATTPKTEPESSPLTKAEASELLGVSARTLSRYTESGRLPSFYVRGPGGQQEARFERGAVEALKRELEAPAFRGVVESTQMRSPAAPGRAIAAAAAPAGIDWAFIVERAKQYALPAPKPWLSLQDAAEYSGLPASFLLAQARAGLIRAVNVGTGAREFWRFNREALAK